MGNINAHSDRIIYICNQAGCHGHFLQYLLDRFSNHTPTITTLPFNNLGNSHKRWHKSNKFKFIDVVEVKTFLRTTTGKKNIIQITIDESILYFERAFMSRARDSNTNLYDIESIRHRLIDNGSNFPEVCEKNKISLKEGYKIAFSNLENCGARKRDLEFKTNPYLQKHNVVFFPAWKLSSRKVSLKITSTAGVHQMRLLHRNLLYHCLRCQSITFFPRNRQYSSFENNTGPTDLRTDGRTDMTSYRDA